MENNQYKIKCDMCNTFYSKKYMSRHLQSFKHIENTLKYNLQETVNQRMMKIKKVQKFEKCFKLLGDELSSPFLSNVIGEHYNFLNFDKYYKDNYYKILATFIVVNDEDCIPNLICYLYYYCQYFSHSFY